MIGVQFILRGGRDMPVHTTAFESGRDLTAAH